MLRKVGVHSRFLVKGGWEVEAEATRAGVPGLLRVDKLVASNGRYVRAGSWGSVSNQSSLRTQQRLYIYQEIEG